VRDTCFVQIRYFTANQQVQLTAVCTSFFHIIIIVLFSMLQLMYVDTVGVGSAATDDRDPSQTLTLIQPPLFELNGIFESALENGRRNEEIMRRNALFSANAKKYDILERIRFRVGGLSSELADLVRRVLSSRQISSSILSKLGQRCDTECYIFHFFANLLRVH
jgi:hypothetical protein